MTHTKNKVIIVDDDEDLLKLLSSNFSAKGYEVISFTSGKEGLNYLINKNNHKSIALIILDRILPDMDGIEILNEVKSSVEIPILILSVLSSEKDTLEGLKRGAVDYIAKPFVLSVFMQKAIALIKD